MLKKRHHRATQLAKRILHLPIRWARWWIDTAREVQHVDDYRWGQQL